LSEPKPTSTNPMTPPEETAPAAGAGDARLVPAYLFEEFVVGAHNRFPHAAALAVSENLGKAYNPLFIYGPVGIGKTHLMQAVGHRVRQRDPNTRVLYVTAQQFMTEVIELLQAGKLQTLRERYRALDLLLVDDIQFLATSEATQEEFFHTFNDLHASGKQIIMTSDRPPKMLTTLEDRLRSRFEWGLIADVKPTNLETRMAILRKKEVHLKGLHLSDEIILYIATRLKSNVRELEGFLRRIQAYTQLNAQEITLPLVQEILKELLPPEEWSEEGGKTAPAVEMAAPASPLAQDIAEVREEKKPEPPADVRVPPPSPPPEAKAPPPEIKAPPPPETEAPPPPRIEKPAPPPPETGPEPMAIPELPSETTEQPPKIVRPAKAPFTPPPIVRPAQPPRAEGGPSPKTPLPTPMPGRPAPPPGTPGPLPPVAPPVRPGAPIGGPPPVAPRPPLPGVKPPAPAPAPMTPGPGVSVPGGLTPNTGAIPVAFFFPQAQEKELDRMRKKFEEIIKKHKLKFTLHSAVESAYPMDASLNYDDFLTKCTEAQVSIAIVLGPPPESAIQETVFFNQLQEALDKNQVSLQMVPWDELGKDYRFLNLALDITLLRIKQKKP
jgi:Holliday junction resolvasome RuvABC ATP-dependent DNA helicase subunit